MLRCARVWDGNTIQASDGTWLILNGVVTPSLESPGGTFARDLLRNLVLNNPIDYAVTGTLRGAWLADVWMANSNSVNGMVRQAGYGSRIEAWPASQVRYGVR